MKKRLEDITKAYGKLDERLETLEKARAIYIAREDEAREAGRLKGIKVGRKDKAMEIVRNLLEILDDETIARVTELPLVEIKNLRF